mmetsp:Transcript_27496/g.88803  ORF Transcript_27496/g.88803 Transcript_27496/m.88803 type:complete len:239 (-) Transcript_27496:584-1300(-)
MPQPDRRHRERGTEHNVCQRGAGWQCGGRDFRRRRLGGWGGASGDGYGYGGARFTAGQGAVHATSRDAIHALRRCTSGQIEPQKRSAVSPSEVKRQVRVCHGVAERQPALHERRERAGLRAHRRHRRKLGLAQNDALGAKGALASTHGAVADLAGTLAVALNATAFAARSTGAGAAGRVAVWRTIVGICREVPRRGVELRRGSGRRCNETSGSGEGPGRGGRLGVPRRVDLVTQDDIV